MIITAVNKSEVLNILSEVHKLSQCIKITQIIPGDMYIKTYRYRTGYPNGIKNKSVTGWYSIDYKEDRLYMTSQELAQYIVNVNCGLGGQNIKYIVESIGIQ